MSSVPRNAVDGQEADTTADVINETSLPSWERLANPPAACPGCVARAGQPWPEYTTSRYCRRCLAQLRRSVQCHLWNSNNAHQVAAGKARATQFTPESQAAAGLASFAAFSARWRASQGLAPLVAADVRRYVVPDMIRSLIGVPLAPALQETIWRAWCAGNLVGVAGWLGDDPPPDPHGLWTSMDDPEEAEAAM